MYGRSRNLREEKGLDGIACAKVWHRDAICNSRGSPYSPSLSENLNDISAIVFFAQKVFRARQLKHKGPFQKVPSFRNSI